MEKRKLRAAAYCRVSTGTDLQDGSFETQCSYYQRRIEEDPALVCAGIYGDQGKSGRSIRSRPALQQLLKDCEEGRIDLILTKSVSRFARNLQECVEMTRRLSDLGVTVRFEREGLDTGSMDGELMLGILAAIAQEESASISSNIQWSRKKHLEKGQPWEKARYGYVSVGKEHIWQVVPREAAIVHRAFCMAALCRSTREIAAEIEEIRRLLASNGVLTRNGTPLSHSNILYILQNEAYIGDRSLLKTTIRKNEEDDTIYLKADHTPIIPYSLWKAVSEKLQRSRQIADLAGHPGGRPHFLYGKLFCAACGAPMTRRTLTSRKGTRHKVWVCRERRKGKAGNGCTMRKIREDNLLRFLCDQLGYANSGKFPTDRFSRDVARVQIEMAEISYITREERL